MATLKVRTTVTQGNTSTVSCDGSKDIVLHVKSGEASVEVIVDSAQTDGYRFKMSPGAITITAAYSLILTCTSTADLIYEAYAAA